MLLLEYTTAKCAVKFSHISRISVFLRQRWFMSIFVPVRNFDKNDKLGGGGF